jgi:Flp pilus assembly CpaF family ATPase
MILIINQSRFNRVTAMKVSLVLNSERGIEILPDEVSTSIATLQSDELGTWRIVARYDNLVQINCDPIRSHLFYRVRPSDLITIDDQQLQLRENDFNSPLTRALNEKRYLLQAELHHAVLDRMRTRSSTDDDSNYRKTVEQELDAQLGVLVIGSEMEEFLSLQSLLEILVDRELGYGRASRRHLRQAWISNFEPTLTKITDLIRLSEEETREGRLERIEALVPWLMRVDRQLLSNNDKRDMALGLLREQLIDCMFGLGPLEDLMVAPGISEIMLLPSGDIFVERQGRIVHSGRRMPSVEISRRVIERIVMKEGRRIDQSVPMVDARLADGSRGNFIIEPVSVRGPALTIRRFAERHLTLHDLVANGSLTIQVAAFLRACVLAQKNILISGGTGSGKTTLLNAISAYIPENERIVTVEDTAEISLPQEHVVTLQARNANLEGQGMITIRHLVKNALRMRPDRIVIGECRGGEALDMLQAMNTGHDGSLTTIHANDPAGALRRIITLALDADGISLPEKAILEQATAAVDLIVQIERFQNGRRRLTSICEVVGLDEETGRPIIEEIYRIRHNRKMIRLSDMEQSFTGYVPTFIDALISEGGLTIESMI